MQENMFERTLLALSEAALDDSRLVSAAAMISDLVRATGHSIAWGDPSATHAPEVFFARCFAGTERRKDWERAYFGDCWGRDECIPRLHSLQDGQCALIRDLYTDEEKKTSPVYNEFRRVTRSQDGLFVVLDGSDGCRVLWSIADSTEPEGWDSGQIKIIKRLAPHIRQFARVRRVLADAGALGASLTEMLDNTRSGIIHLGRRGEILAANDRARELLLKGDGLDDRDGMLTVGTADEMVELERLLGRALPPYGVPGEGGSMKITRRWTPAPLVLEVHPARGVDADYRTWEVAAIVLVVDPLSRARIDPASVATVLDLTPTETRVAIALAAGQPVTDIARALGRAESTVRTHLKRIYRKLGISKQTELAGRILALEGLSGFLGSQDRDTRSESTSR
ncbi:MAG: LuxR C-terminal-related transcriptional regulator [Gemmatimonadota bacterium]|nr:LuxR C-terminal-related transcriptional regulator [Gemmatimonadota bacterium]